MSKRSMIEALREIELELHSMLYEAKQLEKHIDCPPRAISSLISTASIAVEEARGWLQDG